MTWIADSVTNFGWQVTWTYLVSVGMIYVLLGSLLLSVVIEGLVGLVGALRQLLRPRGAELKGRSEVIEFSPREHYIGAIGGEGFREA